MLDVVTLYRYYIPCAGDSQKYHPSKCDYQPRLAEVDNHISRDDIFDYHPSRKRNIYFIISNRTLDFLFSEVELLLLLNRPFMVRGDQRENNEQPLIYMLE